MSAQRIFFGDRERAFALPLPQLEELERVTRSTFGELFNRVRTFNFAYGDLAHTIRLGLIGGGETSPKEAADLIAAYVAPPNPLGESCKLVFPILDAAMFGTATLEGTDGAA